MVLSLLLLTMIVKLVLITDRIKKIKFKGKMENIDTGVNVYICIEGELIIRKMGCYSILSFLRSILWNIICLFFYHCFVSFFDLRLQTFLLDRYVNGGEVKCFKSME